MADASQRVSVVVSCYNYGGFLAGAVESALRQTHRDLDVVIVDDGSTDDTAQVAAALMAADSRVSYVRQANQGQAVAKNTGIDRSSGAFVAFLDADDRWHPDKLEKQLARFTSPRVGVVYSRMRSVDADGRPLHRRDEAPARMPRRGHVTDTLLIDNFIPFSSTVVRREVFGRVGKMDTGIAMGIDWDLWLRASVHFEFDFVDEELLDYRVGHAGQMSLRQEERFSWADMIMNRFLEKNPGAVSEAVVADAWAHTYSSRGYFYRQRDVCRSTGFYFKSIRTRPIQLNAYRGLLGNLWAWSRGGGTGRTGLPAEKNR